MFNAWVLGMCMTACYVVSLRWFVRGYFVWLLVVNAVAVACSVGCGFELVLFVVYDCGTGV